MGIEIETSQIAIDRGLAAYKVMHEAGIHGDKHGSMEGLLVLMIATTFLAKQYAISPRKLTLSISDVYNMVKKSQKYCGDRAGVAEVVTEMALN